MRDHAGTADRSERKLLLEQVGVPEYLLTVELLHVVGHHGPFLRELHEGIVPASPFVGDILVISLQEVKMLRKAALASQHHLEQSQVLPHFMIHVPVAAEFSQELHERLLPADVAPAFGMEGVSEADHLDRLPLQQFQDARTSVRTIPEGRQKKLHPAVKIRNDEHRKRPVQVDQPAGEAVRAGRPQFRGLPVENLRRLPDDSAVVAPLRGMFPPENLLEPVMQTLLYGYQGNLLTGRDHLSNGAAFRGSVFSCSSG